MQIIALHGFLGLPTDWEACAIPNLIAIDLHDLRFPKPSQGLEAWAKAFNRFIRSQPFVDRVLLGYSLGGRLALHVVLQDPSLWKGAIFLSTHPGLQTDHEKAERLQSDKLWADRFLVDPWDKLINAWDEQPVFKHSVTPHRPESAFNRRTLAEALKGWSLGHQQDFASKFLSFPIPYLWAVGEHDHKFQRIAPCKPYLISNAGHRIPYDLPGRVMRELQNFLEVKTNVRNSK